MKQRTHLLVKCLKVLLLTNLEKDLHGVSIIISFSESRKVLLHIVPFTCAYTVFKVPHVEEKARLLLQPKRYNTLNLDQKFKALIILPTTLH